MISHPKKLRTNINNKKNFVEATPFEEEAKKNISKESPKSLLTDIENIETTSNSDDFGSYDKNLNYLNNSKNIIEHPLEFLNKKFNKEYLDEIYINLLLDEKKFEKKVDPDYLSFQKSINDKMRAILVDWIIEIHCHYNFITKTLFQCIFIIDAYLSKNIVDRNTLQLVGVTSLLISCKENEIIYPSINKFIQITDNAYTVEELKIMEKKIIKSLNFDILSPTAEEFFDINAEYFNFTKNQKSFGNYFLKCSLVDYNMLKYKQSTIAIACGYITMKYFNLEGVKLIVDNGNFGIKQKEIKNCVKDLCFLVKDLYKSSLGVAKNIYINNKIITNYSE
jgi:hypothetical protein